MPKYLEINCCYECPSSYKGEECEQCSRNENKEIEDISAMPWWCPLPETDLFIKRAKLSDAFDALQTKYDGVMPCRDCGVAVRAYTMKRGRCGECHVKSVQGVIDAVDIKSVEVFEENGE